MAEYGSKEFIELWRQKGLFAALDTSAKHGRYTREGLSRAVTMQMQNKMAELRKQLAQAQTAMDRIDHSIQSGTRGGKVEQVHLDASMIELAERVRAFASMYDSMKWFLPEAAYRKAWICPGKDSVPAGHGSQPLVP